MKTSTPSISRLAPAAAALALLACLPLGCKPERAGVTAKPSEAAPAQDSLAPPKGATTTTPPVSINATQGDGDLDPNAESFTVAGLTFLRPEGWSLATPGPMRVAELTNDSMPEGAIVFTHFGARGAGAVADNLTRWARQVVDESGEPTLPEVTEASSTHDGVTRKVTFARYQGTYLTGVPGQTPTPVPGTLFLGGIIEGGPEGTVYVRAFGPAAQMADHVEAVLEMLLAEGAGGVGGAE